MKMAVTNRYVLPYLDATNQGPSVKAYFLKYGVHGGGLYRGVLRERGATGGMDLGWWRQLSYI